LQQRANIYSKPVNDRGGRRGGLMVSALDSGTSSLGSSPGLGHCVVSTLGRARCFTFTVPLSTQVYKWVPVNLMLGVTLRWTSIPSSGEEIHLVALCYRNQDKFRPDRPFDLFHQNKFQLCSQYLPKRGFTNTIHMQIYFMASSMSGQDEPSPAL